MEKNDNEWVSRVYRNYLESKIDRCELGKEKKAFIKEHFPPEPLFIFRPPVWVPALSVLVFSFAVWLMPQLQSPVLKLNVSQVQPTASAEEFEIHPVDVKRAASRVGTVMVYQKLYKENPITIVWVFPNSNGGVYS